MLQKLQKTVTQLQREDPKRHVRQVLFQSLFGAVFLFAVFLGSDLLGSGLLAASIGASTFLAFAFPLAESASPRYMLGGYACGLICGAAAGWVLHRFPHLPDMPWHAAACMAAVLCTMLLMVFLDFQHPPAVAAALTMVDAGTPWSFGLYTMLCVCALCLLRWLLRKIMVNL